MNSLIITCCVFSFICGTYFTVMMEKDKGCTVEITRGQVTTVTIGRRP